MKTPYLIAHMLSSIDGRTTAHLWPNNMKTAHLFESTAEKIKADAWIVGRTTMQEFASKKNHKLPKPHPSLNKKEDFIGQHKTKTYAVAIDPSGKCRWDSSMTTTEHVIEVLTHKVPPAYLQHLRDKQVSYLFAGKSQINLQLALHKLATLFNIKTARVDGGGHTWGVFLKANLLDEISHVIVPTADGALGTPTMFDIDHGRTNRQRPALQLKSLKRLPNSVLWLRYRVKKT
ncbi:MAG: dihydrofolate reductase family protein [Phycisphaerae bacterium]